MTQPETCISCGDIIPEGMQVCPDCMMGAKDKKERRPMMTKFKVGDRVRFDSGVRSSCYPPKGTTGKIIYNDGSESPKIRWDGGVLPEYNHETYVHYSRWHVIQDQKILITTDGTTTLARLYEGKEVVKSAEAKCSQKDTFDFEVGARLAFDRLIGTVAETPPGKIEDKPEPIKSYCVKDYNPGKFLTKGKIYEIAYDGACITFEDGWTFNFEMGLARFDNLTIVPNCLVPLVQRPAKVGEYITPIAVTGYARYDNRYDLHDLLKVTEDDSNIIKQWVGKAVGFENITHPGRPWKRAVIVHEDYLVLDGYQPEPEFKPHLVCGGDNYGEVGEETNYTDAIGRKLYVGDVVEFFPGSGPRGLRFVVKDMKSTSYCRNKRFVMGIETSCNDKTGEIKGWKVFKSRGFETLKHGEVIDGIEYRGEAIWSV